MLRLSVVLLAGCGLLSSDLTNFNLSFPKKDFRVDSADWHVNGSGSVPTVPCAAGCSNASAFCGGGCSVDCQQSSQTCQAHVTFALINDYNLATEAPEFQAIADHKVVSVTVDGVYFDITENTLTVATPPLSIYLGPMTATGPGDAELVGTIASVASHQTGQVTIDFAANGRAVMKKYMDDFHTPFRTIIAGEETLHAGDPIPSGRLVGSVLATAHAGI
jgi:hypothetical protein